MSAPHRLIPFDDINAAILGNGFLGWLERMFPNGRRKGHEFVVGNIEGDAGDSLSVSLKTGKWADFHPGGPSGPDPISLYAAKYHDKQRVPAARELYAFREIALIMNREPMLISANCDQSVQPESVLGVEFGLMDSPKANGHANGKVVPLRPTAPAPEEKSPAEDWKPIIPVPSDAPAPDLSRWDDVFPHYNGDGELIRYMLRRNAVGDKKKIVRPLTFGSLNGKLGWHCRHELEPRHLFGLDKLALLPDASPLIVMGEKKARALQEVYPDRPVITWSAGDKSVGKNDWTPLRSKKAIIWPDADESGKGAADELTPILLSLDCTVWAVDVTGQPEGWDCYDAIHSDGWGADEITAWIKPRLKQRRKSAPKGSEEALRRITWEAGVRAFQ